MKAKKILKYAAIAAGALLVVAGGIGLYRKSSGSGRNGKSESHAEIVVNVVSVEPSVDVRTVPYVGKVKASQSTNVSSMNGGKVQQLMVEKGARVRSGEVVAVISSEYVQSAYDIASVTLRQAQDGYDRMMQLYRKGGVTELKKMEVETQLEKARAAYRSSEDALEKCNVTAPYDGIVEDIFVDEGIEIGPLVPVFRISDIRKLEIEFPVPENEIASVSLGEPAEIVIPALDLTLDGSVSIKGISASLLSHTYDCRVDMKSSAKGLLPGMVCKVFLHKENEGVVVIPLKSVMVDNDGRYVWSVADGVVEKTRVVVDGFAAEGVIISSGLKTGDLVIVDGKRKVSTGMKVKTVLI